MIGVQVFGKGKIYKPTWTQNHPLAFGQRMVLCPALEINQVKNLKNIYMSLLISIKFLDMF